MLQQFLSGGYSLGMERQDKRIRLVVLHNDTEVVCRSEHLRVLEQFAATPVAHIFRGRLQLQKEDGGIHVAVKGARLGTLSLAGFTGALMILKTAPRA